MSLTLQCGLPVPIRSHAWRPGQRDDCWLQPGSASPLPVQRRGLRRAQARFCQASGVLLCACGRLHGLSPRHPPPWLCWHR